MKYLCLVYQDEQELAKLSLSEYQELLAETLAFRNELRETGHYVASNALEFVQSATSLRIRQGNVVITDGPFIESHEQIGGYFLIEARDLNDAIRIASKMPPARLGGIEVRPVKHHVLDEPFRWK